MELFRAISDTIGTILKRHKAADPVDKTDILNLIENNLIVLRLVVDTTTNNKDLLKSIQTTMLVDNGSNKDNKAARAIYDSYVKALSPAARSQERTAFLQSIASAATLLLADHQLLRDQFDMVFKDGTDVGDITLEQMRLSHAMVFGFINLTNLLTDWFCFLLGSLNGNPNSTWTPPAYREVLLRNSSADVASFVNDVLSRGTSRNILALVQTVRKSGDVAIYVNAATLDTYANISDYPGIKNFVNNFNVFQPILFVRDTINNVARYFYKRNLVMRDWLQAKIVILTMDAEGMDRDSPDYQRQIQLVQRYSDALASYDRKIADYEAS